MRIVLLLLGVLLFARRKREATPDLTPEKVAFIEEKTKAYFDYVLDSYDQAKAEGRNVLQWLFGAAIGGIGLVGTLAKNEYWCLAIGALVASVWAAYAASRLIPVLRARDVNPPGNSAESLNSLLDEPEHRLRWREAKGVDLRTRENIAVVEVVSGGVDKAREAIILIPLFFIAGAVLSLVAKVLLSEIPCLLPARQFLKAYLFG